MAKKLSAADLAHQKRLEAEMHTWSQDLVDKYTKQFQSSNPNQNKVNKELSSGDWKPTIDTSTGKVDTTKLPTGVSVQYENGSGYGDGYSVRYDSNTKTVVVDYNYGAGEYKQEQAANPQKMDVADLNKNSVGTRDFIIEHADGRKETIKDAVMIRNNGVITSYHPVTGELINGHSSKGEKGLYDADDYAFVGTDTANSVTHIKLKDKVVPQAPPPYYPPETSWPITYPLEPGPLPPPVPPPPIYIPPPPPPRPMPPSEPAYETFNVPMPTFSSNLQRQSRFIYFFGIDKVEAKNIKIENTAIRQFAEVKTNGAEWITLETQHYAPDKTGIEYSLIDGTSEIPILPNGETTVMNERLFPNLETRFTVDRIIDIRRNGEVVNLSIDEAKNKRDGLYSVSYETSNANTYRPTTETVGVKATLRSYSEDVDHPYIEGVQVRLYGGEGVLWQENI